MSITLPITDHLLFHGDCLEIMPQLPDKCVDMVLCDLPYGITQNKWDEVIPMAKLWEQWYRICKDSAAIVLTTSQPFTTTVIHSNFEHFKYAWVWDKVNRFSGHLNAKKQPLRITEDILVFYRAQCIYNPQFTEGKPYVMKSGKPSSNYGSQISVITDNKGTRHPKNLLSLPANSKGNRSDHPTQKPVSLFEYLLFTYTNVDAVILDNTCGSGTTGVACVNTGRISIQIEQDEKYVQIAKQRLLAAEEALKCKSQDPVTSQPPALSPTDPTDSASPKELEPSE